MLRYINYVILLSVLAACGRTTTGGQEVPIVREIEVRYAKGFRLFQDGDATILEVTKPFPEATESLKYRLSNEPVDGKRNIQVPVERLVCTSTTHLPMIDYLGSTGRLVGFPNTDYISTPSVRQRIESGGIMELGNVADLNMENLIEADPDLVVSYSMDNLKLMDRIEKMGFPVVLNGDYLEEHPLGRAEWIKVFGVLLGEFEKADSVFRRIEADYLRIADMVQSLEPPCVFSGSLYGDSWYMPGGNNYAANLLKEAGFAYVLDSDSTSGFLRWGFENVYEVAKDCEYWISPAPFQDLKTLGAADERYQGFEAWKEGKVYVYDKRLGPTGGNEFLELGYLRPDIILRDLVLIRDPTLFPGEELYFYRKLN